MFRRRTAVRRAVALVTGAVAVLVLAPVATTTATAAVPLPGIRAAGTPGISPGSGLAYLSATDRETVLQGMEDAGTRWVRFDLEWKYVQRTSAGPATWVWDAYDQLIPAITRHGMTPLAILGKTPDWARGSGCDRATYPDPDACPPDTDAFAAFAYRAVQRYSALREPVKHWEIWNEPNNSVAWKAPNPERYARLLIATSAQIRRADAGAFVITGGLAPLGNDPEGTGDIDEVAFLRRVYAVAGARRSFDAVAAHPYSFPDLPRGDRADSGWSQLAKSDPSLRSVMVKNSDGDKKIWLTEFGAPTAGDRAVSEDQQALAIQQAFTLARGYSWAGPLFVYSWQDKDENGDRAPDGTEGNFGLLRVDSSPKPAYDRYVQAATGTS